MRIEAVAGGNRIPDAVGTDRRAGSDCGDVNPGRVLPGTRAEGRSSRGPVFRHVSTATVPADCRFDYWRSLFAASRMECPRASRDEPFEGTLLQTAPSQGIRFLHLANTALTCHFGGRDPDELVLAYMRHGSVQIRHGRDRETLVNPESGLLVFDQDRPMVTAHQRVGWTCLKLSRVLVVEALGAQPVARDEVIRPFRHSGRLLSGLVRLLDDMVEVGQHLDPIAAASAVHTARSLVLTLLAKRNPKRRLLSSIYDDALLTAARHQLQVYAGDPELNGARVAATLGCSRVHLYRQFARQGTCVREALHAARLGRARELMLATDAPIGTIAWQCGYTSPTAFDRAFRQRFGIIPTDLRQRHPAAHA